MKYQSELIKEIVDNRGHETSSLHYESECIEAWIDETKGAYPKLCDYQSEWLNYIVENPIGKFPYKSVVAKPTVTVENVVPYSYKSAILKGNTLVNLNKVTIEDSSYQVFKDGWQTITTREQNYNIWETGDVSLFKTNTQYLVIIEVKQNNISYDFDLLVGHDACVFSLGETTGKTRYKSGEIGRKVLTLTTKNNFDGVTCVQRFATDNQLSVSNETVTYRMMFIEYQDGMENWDIPYFEGMQSVKMPVLKTTGKNLFDKEAFYNDWKSKKDTYVYKEIVDNEEVLKVNNFNHLFGDDKGFRINVKKGALLTMSFKCKKAGTLDTKAVFSVRFSDTAFKDIGRCNSYEWTQVSESFIPTRDYITVCSAYEKDDYFYIKDIQLEYGEQLTTYEPYKSNILTVNEDVTLRSNGNICDELNLLTGQLTQRIDEDGEVLSQEVVKTVDLTVTNQNGETMNRIRPIEGTMHLTVSGTPICPTGQFEIPVEAITQNLSSFIEE